MDHTKSQRGLGVKLHLSNRHLQRGVFSPLQYIQDYSFAQYTMLNTLLLNHYRLTAKTGIIKY